MIGVIYNFNTRLIQRIIVPDKDAELNTIPLGVGEGIIRVPKFTYSLFSSHKKLATSLGLAG